MGALRRYRRANRFIAGGCGVALGQFAPLAGTHGEDHGHDGDHEHKHARANAAAERMLAGTGFGLHRRFRGLATLLREAL